MGLAKKLDIPSRPTEKRTWSFKQMFPVAAIAGKIMKTLQNPLEIMLAMCLVAAIFVEIIGRDISLYFLIVILFLISECSYERIKIKPITDKEKHE